MADIQRLLGRLYEGFVLRDLLGFVAPGSVSLISIAIVLAITHEQAASDVVKKFRELELSEWWQIVVFFVTAYLWAWVLQALHYGIIARIIGFERFFGGGLSGLDSLDTEKVHSFLQKSSPTTRAALQPDWLLAQLMKQDERKKFIEELPYTERLSALMAMSGNLAMAFLLLALLILFLLSNYILLATLSLLFSIPLLYEHRRLWIARNLRVAIYAARPNRMHGDGAPDGWVRE